MSVCVCVSVCLFVCAIQILTHGDTQLNLDHVAQAGLPIWVTELDVWQQDPDVRADYYDTVLRVFFSHPSVEGIVFWGFWDQQVVDKTSSLVDGQHLTVSGCDLHQDVREGVGM